MAQDKNSGRSGNQGGQGNQGGNQGNQGGRENTSGRGFAGMDEDKQREIASKGGRASHEQGTGHEFNSEEAREAGRKGGQSRGGSQGGNK